MRRRPKYAQCVDQNQAEIVEALRKAGCDVLFINVPADLLVGHRGKCFLVECKLPEGGKPTPEQEKFRESWRGQYAIARTPEEALRAVGL